MVELRPAPSAIRAVSGRGLQAVAIVDPDWFVPLLLDCVVADCRSMLALGLCFLLGMRPASTEVLRPSGQAVDSQQTLMHAWLRDSGARRLHLASRT